MVVIGVDPHKRQHTAAALEQATQRPLDKLTIEASLPEYRRLLAWARQWPDRKWAVENARGPGRHLAQWLLELLEAAGSTLTGVDGVGPVLAARLLGRTGSPARFASGSHYASYTGTAPIEVASAEHARHRLSRSGDRQLNAALHLVAVTQARMPRSAGHAYVQRKLAEGKTRNEALRCLKRRLASHLLQIMLTDERRRSASAAQAPPAAA